MDADLVTTTEYHTFMYHGECLGRWELVEDAPHLSFVPYFCTQCRFGRKAVVHLVVYLPAFRNVWLCSHECMRAWLCAWPRHLQQIDF